MKVTKSKLKPVPTSGGSFTMRSGKPVPVGGGTSDHPEGNGPRPATPVDAIEPAAASAEKSDAGEASAKGGAGKA